MKKGESVYDQGIFSANEVKEGLIKFLKTAGYEVIPKTIGFVTPDIYAEKGDYQISICIRDKVEEAVEACKDLAAIKCFLGAKKDYVVALPPVSETEVLQLLFEKDEWYFPMSEQTIMLWLINPERMEAHPIVGWPYDESLLEYLTNPEAANLIAQLAGQKMNQQLMEEEDLF